MTYNFEDDFRKSIDLCYEVIRARKAAGGSPWVPYVRQKMKYIFPAEVIALGEDYMNVHKSGVGKEAVFERVSGGWHMSVRVAGSLIGFRLADKPEFEVGDKIRVTLEKIGA